MLDQGQHRVLFTATLARKHIAKFHIPYLKLYKEMGWETWVAAKNDYPDAACEIPYCDHFVDIPFERSPFSSRNLAAHRALKELLAHERFDIIHAHTPVGSVLTRLAARRARKEGTKLIYTAHGLHFYTGAKPLFWMLWYPIERLMSRFTDVLITINQEDYKRAQRFAHCRVSYLLGVGIDTAELMQRASVPVKLSELGVPDGATSLLAVGDLITRKNMSCAVEALARLDEKYHLLICGSGWQESMLSDRAAKLGVANRVHFLGYRNDVPAVMALSDVLVFPSLQEGLPITVLEAMALQLPVVASKIRGVYPDIIEDGINGLLLDRIAPESIAICVRKLEEDSKLRNSILENAKNGLQSFELDCVLNAYKEVVQSLCAGDTFQISDSSNEAMA